MSGPVAVRAKTAGQPFTHDHACFVCWLHVSVRSIILDQLPLKAIATTSLANHICRSRQCIPLPTFTHV